MFFLWFLVGFHGFSFFKVYHRQQWDFFTKASGPMFLRLVDHCCISDGRQASVQRCDVRDVSLKVTVWWPISKAISQCDAMFAMYRSSLPSDDQLAGRYRDAMQCLRCIAQVYRLVTNWQGGAHGQPLGSSTLDEVIGANWCWSTFDRPWLIFPQKCRPSLKWLVLKH